MTAALALGGLGFVVALLLSVAQFALARRASKGGGEDAVIRAVDALLPQSQCGQCGHPGCRPYAEAVVAGERADLCLPGGPETAARLQALLGRESETTAIAEPRQLVARIVEPRCVGCARCIDACPVDAIVGAANYLHAVVAEHCTGCELCVPVCPVDCIELIEWTPPT